MAAAFVVLTRKKFNKRNEAVKVIEKSIDGGRTFYHAAPF